MMPHRGRPENSDRISLDLLRHPQCSAPEPHLDARVETLAQAIFAAHASWQAEMGTAPAAWTEIRPRSREYWRRLARAGLETMEGSPNG